MASFSDLPNELVREVASHLTAEAIERFTLAAEGIYAVGLPLLKEHRELKKRYSDFKILDQAKFDDFLFLNSDSPYYPVTLNCPRGDSFSNLLTDVLTSHRMAPYVKELRLEGWAPVWGSTTLSPAYGVHIPYTKEQFVLFRQALSRYVMPTKLATWIEELESGNENPVISLLLILLPNIKSIIFKQCSRRAYEFRKVVQRIKVDCLPGTSVLNHLERISLQYEDYQDTAPPQRIDFLGFLLTIPSLKSLYGQHLCKYHGNLESSCLLPYSSNVTDLALKTCDLSLAQLGDLFRALKALKKFHYIDNAYKNDTNEAHWNPGGICRLLSKYAHKSLEVLDLRSETEPIERIGSLRDLEVLKELTLRSPLFGFKRIFQSRSLASQLPESIERISLHDTEIGSGFTLENTIREVIRFKAKRLPRLEKVYLSGLWDLEKPKKDADKLQQLCEEASFELCIVERGGRGE